MLLNIKRSKEPGELKGREIRLKVSKRGSVSCVAVATATRKLGFVFLAEKMCLWWRARARARASTHAHTHTHTHTHARWLVTYNIDALSTGRGGTSQTS